MYKLKDINGAPKYVPGALEETICYELKEVRDLKIFSNANAHLRIEEFHIPGVNVNWSRDAKNNKELMDKLIYLIR